MRLLLLPLLFGIVNTASAQAWAWDDGTVPFVVTPKPNDAWSGVALTVPLPVTVIVNPEGQEVARLIGDAHWDGADAQAVLKALIAGQ